MSTPIIYRLPDSLYYNVLGFLDIHECGIATRAFHCNHNYKCTKLNYLDWSSASGGIQVSVLKLYLSRIKENTVVFPLPKDQLGHPQKKVKLMQNASEGTQLSDPSFTSHFQNNVAKRKWMDLSGMVENEEDVELLSQVALKNAWRELERLTLPAVYEVSWRVVMKGATSMVPKGNKVFYLKSSLLVKIINSCPNLKELKVSRASNKQLKVLLPACNKINKLVLESCNLNKKHSECLESMTSLKSLIIEADELDTGNTSQFGKGYDFHYDEEFVKNYSKLKVLQAFKGSITDYTQFSFEMLTKLSLKIKKITPEILDHLPSRI